MATMTLPRHFISGTHQHLSWDDMVSDMLRFVTAFPADDFHCIIGTDSQPRLQCRFVTAIVLHRIGHGGRFYYAYYPEEKTPVLSQRMYEEAARSLLVGEILRERFAHTPLQQVPMEIHLDVGLHGASRQVASTLRALVEQSGYIARIKPDAFGASKVADRYTK
ncbi:MAG: ribonuclease H-like YkuK family protein [Firmicutes bacterium]|nr:ribonuclease H-like YkuK family protein [Bacillota bacterium]